MQFKAICNRESASASLPLFGTAHCKKRLTLWPGKSIFLAMKLTAILATVFVLHVSARAISQTISFAGKDIPLVKAFEAIKSQTGYVYFCDAAILADAAVLIGAAILTSAAIRLLIGVATIVPVLRAGTGAHAQRRDRQTGGDEYFRHFHLASSRPWIGLNRRYASRSIAFLNWMLMFC